MAIIERIKEKLYGKKIEYQRTADDKGLTPCPYGGSIASSGYLHEKAMVGSGACHGCIYNNLRFFEFTSIRCKAKRR